MDVHPIKNGMYRYWPIPIFRIKTVAQLRSEKKTQLLSFWWPPPPQPATFSPITWPSRGVCTPWAAGLERIPPGTRAPHGRPHPQRAALRRCGVGVRPWKTLEDPGRSPMTFLHPKKYVGVKMTMIFVTNSMSTVVEKSPADLPAASKRCLSPFSWGWSPWEVEGKNRGIYQLCKSGKKLDLKEQIDD